MELESRRSNRLLTSRGYNMKLKDLLQIIEKNTKIIVVIAETDEEHYFDFVKEVHQKYMDKEVELIGASIFQSNVIEILLK